jgi:hypothetical protein
MTGQQTPGEVLLEFRRLGNYLKATAIHVASDTEVSVVGPVGAQEALRQVVMRKLEFMLEQKRR